MGRMPRADLTDGPRRTTAELEAELPRFEASPKDAGRVMMVVARPDVGERDILDHGVLDSRVGLVGDNWATRGSRRTADGAAHPDMQLNIINHRVIEFLSFGDCDRQALAGDQLHLDLDLSCDNLPPGSRLTLGDPEVGGALLEVTDQPHTGCAKFVSRYGPEAMKFVNGGQGRRLRLRGLNARVVVTGTVRPGDPVTVSRPRLVSE